MNTIEVLEALEATTKRTIKEQILSQNIDNSLLKRIMFLTFDPYTTYGLSSKFNNKKLKSVETCDSETMLSLFVEDLLPKFASRQLTGNVAKSTMIQFFEKCDKLTQKWCERILIKNLRCGVQATTVNKIWKDLINAFEVQLASTLDYSCENEDIIINETLKFPLWSEPKLDGLRLIVIKTNNVVTMFTRNGTQLETLNRLKEYFESRCDIQEMVFDGEGLVSGKWEDTVSVMMAYKNNKNDDNFVYNVFDCMTFEEWSNKECKQPQHVRRSKLDELFKNVDRNIINPTRIDICTSIEDIKQSYRKALSVGFEGVMLKDQNGLYTFDRSKSWKKLKPITTYEGIVVATMDANVGTKREGKFGGFVVLLSNGVTTEVGSGMSDAFKDEMNNDRESCIGCIVECEAQLLTPDGKMRFPRFKRFRDKNDIDQTLFDAYEKYNTRI